MADSRFSQLMSSMESELLALKTAHIKDSGALTMESKKFTLDFYTDEQAITQNMAIVTLSPLSNKVMLSDVTWDGTYYGSNEDISVQTSRVAGDGNTAVFWVTAFDFSHPDTGETKTVGMTATGTSDFSIDIEYDWGNYAERF